MAFNCVFYTSVQTKRNKIMRIGPPILFTCKLKHYKQSTNDSFRMLILHWTGYTFCLEWEGKVQILTDGVYLYAWNI